MNTPTPNRIPVNIEDEMKRSYMDYAMSVIIGRALPDVRDGLKPAHRRVLYGMKAMGLSSTRGYRKCAKIVGEVMGNYPSRTATRRSTTRSSAWRRTSTCATLLIDGQGNFGSIDGDPPAAMRYTEARLEALADEMMADLDKETVDFVPNYDETTEEPTVLPAPFPNLLVNGSAGIAVGMATNIPPHNLREVIDAAIWTIESAQSDDAADARREAAQAARARARARLPHRRLHRRPPGHPAGVPDRPRRRHHAREGGDRGHRRRATARRSSSTRFRIRSTRRG